MKVVTAITSEPVVQEALTTPLPTTLTIAL